MRRLVQIGSVAAALLLVAAASAEAFSLIGVRVTRANETYPAVGVDPATGDEYISWAQSRPGHRNQYDAYLQRNVEPRIKLNTRGIAWTFGLDPVGHQVAYQQDRAGDSNIRLYDYVTGQRDRLNAQVNTPKWEYQPSISGHWLVFARLNTFAKPDVRRLFLYDLTTGTRRVLDSFTGNRDRGDLTNGQVNGDWVVWWKASRHWSVWDVYRYQISTGITEAIPRPAGRYDYAPSVTPDGTVYFFRSGAGCGHLVTARRFDAGGSITLVGSLPAGRDVFDHSFASTHADGSTDVFFDSARCSARPVNFDIYRFSFPAVAPVARSGASPGAVGTAADEAPRLPFRTRDDVAR